MPYSVESWALREGFVPSAWKCVLQHGLAGRAADQSFPTL